MADIFQEGKKTTMIAALVTIFFASAKWIVGSLSGSVVLVADSIHSFADSISTILAWLGLKIAQKKPTKKFPYGYYKAENIVALIISALIFFAGFSIIRESVSVLISKAVKLDIPLAAVAVAFFDALVMFSIGTYEFKVGKRINSQSLMADGKESRMHLLSSSIVLIGLIFSWLDVPYVEGIAGAIISLFVFEVAFESFKDSAFALMDISPSKEFEDKIRKILSQTRGIEKIKEIKLRKSGPLIFGEARVGVEKDIKTNKALEILSMTEKEIRDKIKEVDTFNILISPVEKKKWKLAIPLEESKGLESVVSNHFGRANFFLLATISNKKNQKWEIIENPFQGKDIRAGLAVAELLTKNGVDAVAIKEIGSISTHSLRDNMIEIFKVEGIRAEEVVNNFIAEKREKIFKPTKEKI